VEYLGTQKAKMDAISKVLKPINDNRLKAFLRLKNSL
jgi:hypothetical protein